MSTQEELRAVRLGKRARLADRGIAYPDRFDVTSTCAAAKLDETVRIAGRLTAFRDMGKTIFADVLDGSGTVQIMLRRGAIGPESFDALRELVDLGDFVGCEGVVMLTQTQERTVRVTSVQILSKALLPLPDKFHGLANDEIRFSKRYLEMIVDPSVRARFRTRSRVIRIIRRFLDERGFEEVETPMLQAIPCGASATPFTTEHRATGRTLYLRIAPETYLKRLIVAGFERVYEIGRNFRNEGMDRSHLQEFTMLEWYVTWWNMWDNVCLVRELIQHVVKEIHGSHVIPFAGVDLDFSGEWRVVEYRDLVLGDCGIDVLAYEDADSLLKEIRARNIDVGNVDGAGIATVIDKLYKTVSRPKLVQPTILVHKPTVMVPLARPNDADPRVVDAFHVLVNGWEIVNAYSELVDPVVQREALMTQAAAHEAGDEEAMVLDEPYLEAMEHGMPPNSGLGLGIDRFVALLTGQTTLKEVVIFPLGT